MANDEFNQFLTGIESTLNGTTNQQANNTPSFRNSNFQTIPTPVADGNGLPYNKVPSARTTKGFVRNIIHWFVPEFGIVKMYINPETLTFNFSKQIQSTRTKGGFTIQYWGENLPTIGISGTTGSAGVEGINVLYEIYRAEQYAFDTVGLSLSANNAAIGAAEQMSTGLGNAIGSGLVDVFGGDSGAQAVGGSVTSQLLNSITGISPANTYLSARNIPSLAQLAFGIEMFYMGWVFKGYFTNMSVTESASDFPLKYNMNFTVTQRRGYRVNSFPWQRSPNEGPSQYNTRHSFGDD